MHSWARQRRQRSYQRSYQNCSHCHAITHLNAGENILTSIQANFAFTFLVLNQSDARVVSYYELLTSTLRVKLFLRSHKTLNSKAAYLSKKP